MGINHMPRIREAAWRLHAIGIAQESLASATDRTRAPLVAQIFGEVDPDETDMTALLPFRAARARARVAVLLAVTTTAPSQDRTDIGEGPHRLLAAVFDPEGIERTAAPFRHECRAPLA